MSLPGSTGQSSTPVGWSGFRGRFSASKAEIHQTFMSKFPAQKEQGIFLIEQGI
jgi:hypothetical protein